MGKSSSPDQLAKKLMATADALGSNKAAIERTAFVTKTVFQTALRNEGVTGTTPVSRRVKARYDVKGTQNASAIVRYTGPAHILNNPTRSHGIVSRKSGGSRRSRSRRESGVGTRGAILVNGQPKAYARHPGTRGLGFFQRAKATSVKVVPHEYRKAGIQEPLRRIFR
jgi:hypothetical protein